MPNDPYDLPNASALTAIGRRPAGGGQALGVRTAALADHVCDSWHRRQIRLFPETVGPSRGGGSPVRHPSCEYRRLGAHKKKQKNEKDSFRLHAGARGIGLWPLRLVLSGTGERRVAAAAYLGSANGVALS
jgi:hypothetical protein